MNEIIQKARNECAAISDGQFHPTEQTITLHDFTGDGRPEEVVDGEAYEFLAQKWQVVDVDGLQVLS